MEMLIGGLLTAKKKTQNFLKKKRSYKLTIDILRERYKPRHLPRQFREGIVTRIRRRLQRLVSSVRVEEPDQARIAPESLGRGQGLCIVVPPDASGAAECLETGGCGEPGAAEGEDSGGG